MGILSRLALLLIGKAEKRIGVTFDYIRHMAQTNISLLMRYNKMFSIIDPNKHAPADAFHAVRIRGALAADCGTCVEAEINLAKNAGLSTTLIKDILAARAESDTISAAIDLADAVCRDRSDAPEAREILREAYGETALIELAIAMNGAAMLPGVKRAMGFATACDINVLQGKTL